MDHATDAKPRWALDILGAMARYHPAPSRAKLCISVPDSLRKSLSKEDRESLNSKARALVASATGLAHDSESPFMVEVTMAGADEVSTCLLSRQPLVLAGYYRKRSRRISQTPMFVDNGRRRVGDTSVQEVITAAFAAEFYAADDEKAKEKMNSIGFAGAGREDVDVQVFGSGRMLLLTLPDPTRNGSPSADLLAEFESRVARVSDGLVSLRGLHVATSEDKKYVLEGAELRKKMYVCVVQLEQAFEGDLDCHPIAKLKNVKVLQKTPVRVSHRRAMMVRERIVHSTRLARISPTLLVLSIEAGAGFYIKEFVHGDLGRTSPSVSDLFGCRARLLTLDFLGAVEDESSDKEDDIVADTSKRSRIEGDDASSPLDKISAEWFWE